MSESIGNRIKRLREEREWSQRELADRVEINYSVINRIELDKRPVKDHEISKFADVFSVTTDFLMGKTNDRNELDNQSKIINHDEIYDSLAEITKLAKKYGLEQLGFFDIEEWKNLGPEEIQLLDAQFKAIADMAKKRNEKK